MKIAKVIKNQYKNLCISQYVNMCHIALFVYIFEIRASKYNFILAMKQKLNTTNKTARGFVKHDTLRRKKKTSNLFYNCI